MDCDWLESWASLAIVYPKQTLFTIYVYKYRFDLYNARKHLLTRSLELCLDKSSGSIVIFMSLDPGVPLTMYDEFFTSGSSLTLLDNGLISDTLSWHSTLVIGALVACLVVASLLGCVIGTGERTCNVGWCCSGAGSNVRGISCLPCWHELVDCPGNICVACWLRSFLGMGIILCAIWSLEIVQELCGTFSWKDSFSSLVISLAALSMEDRLSSWMNGDGCLELLLTWIIGVDVEHVYVLVPELV